MTMDDIPTIGGEAPFTPLTPEERRGWLSLLTQFKAASDLEHTPLDERPICGSCMDPVADLGLFRDGRLWCLACFRAKYLAGGETPFTPLEAHSEGDPERYDLRAAAAAEATLEEKSQRLQEARRQIKVLLTKLFDQVIPEEMGAAGGKSIFRGGNLGPWNLYCTMSNGEEIHIAAETAETGIGSPGDPLLTLAVGDDDGCAAGEGDMSFTVRARIALPLDEACERVRTCIRAALQALATVRSAAGAG